MTYETQAQAEAAAQSNVRLFKGYTIVALANGRFAVDEYNGWQEVGSEIEPWDAEGNGCPRDQFVGGVVVAVNPEA